MSESSWDAQELSGHFGMFLFLTESLVLTEEMIASGILVSAGWSQDDLPDGEDTGLNYE